jgi:hypothetical protein
MLMSPSTAVRNRRYRAERSFGLLVGTALLLLGAWWIYRHKFPSVAPAFCALGFVLIALGAVLPKALFWPNRLWMTLAEAMSFVMTRVILAVVFFLVVTPIGLVKRLTGWDPLRRRSASAPSYWVPYTERQREPRHYEKMY